MNPTAPARLRCTICGGTPPGYFRQGDDCPICWTGTVEPIVDPVDTNGTV